MRFSLPSSPTRRSSDLAKIALQKFLLQAHSIHNPQGRAPFAFKLHQFISGPGKVLTTLEPAGQRNITLDAQRFRSEEHTSELQSRGHLVCRLLLEKNKN